MSPREYSATMLSSGTVYIVVYARELENCVAPGAALMQREEATMT
jgi:hypothetical protein